MLTLSQQQLVYLDWHSPGQAKARVTEKELSRRQAWNSTFISPATPPIAIRYDMFPAGGRQGSAGGLRRSRLETFALSFTLVSINGQQSRMTNKSSMSAP